MKTIQSGYEFPDPAGSGRAGGYNMGKPGNPYRKGTRIWLLMEGGLQGEYDGLPGWEDLNVVQIGEVLGCSRSNVRKLLSMIRTQTGYQVPHVDGRTSRWADG